MNLVIENLRTYGFYKFRPYYCDRAHNLIDLQVYKARKQSGGETTGIGKSREKEEEREKENPRWGKNPQDT